MITIPSGKAYAAASNCMGSTLNMIFYTVDGSGNVIKFACLSTAGVMAVFELDTGVATSTFNGLVTSSNFIQAENIS